MKKLITPLVAICFIITVSSCKKDTGSSPTNFSVSAKIDGKKKSFNQNIHAIKSSVSENLYSLMISASSGSEGLNINLWSDKDDFVAGKTFVIASPSATNFNTLTFSSPNNTSDPYALWNSIYQFRIVDQVFECTITEAGDQFVRGTFSGKIYQNSNLEVHSMAVTDGSFLVSY